MVGADRDGRVTARAAGDGRLLGQVQLATPLSALAVATKEGGGPGRLLAAGGDDGVLHPIELGDLVGSGAVAWQPPHRGHLRTGLRLLADAVTPGEPSGDPPDPSADSAAVTAIARGPDGWLAVAGDDGAWRRVEVHGGDDPWATLTATIPGHEGPLGAIAVSPDGGLVATGGWDGLVRLWDARDGRAVGEALAAHADTVATCTFSPDGTVLVSGSWDGTAVLWDVRSGRRLPVTLDAHTDWVTAAAFADGGRLLLTTSNDERIRLWDPRDGSCLLTLRTGRPLGCLAVAGPLVVVGVGRHLVRFRLNGGDDGGGGDRACSVPAVVCAHVRPARRARPRRARSGRGRCGPHGHRPGHHPGRVPATGRSRAPRGAAGPPPAPRR